MATKKAPAKKAAVKKPSAKKVVAKKAPAKKAAVKKKTVKLGGKKIVVNKHTPSTVKNAVDIVVETKGEIHEFKVAPDKIGTVMEDIGMNSTNTQTIVRASYTHPAKGKTKAKTMTVEKVFNVHMARRLFRQHLARVVFEKQIRLALDI